MTKSKPVYGLVLAGGKSRRMGTDKALLGHGGRSQLAHVVALLESEVDRVFVSARPDQAEEPERCRFDLVVDRFENLGPLAGILSAMAEYPDVDWLVVACDLPNISKDTFAHLLANRSPTQPFTAYISAHDGLPEPLCALWSSGTESIIRSFMDEGILCPRKILIRADTHLIEQLDPASLDNINTPADLESSVLQRAP
jgi:molybdopterin-guanine dinucleotide biosynthesis protein A